MKKIIFFTYGDSNNPSTWSNVPYLLTKSFEEKGYIIERIDISTKKTIFYYIYTLLCKFIKPSTTYYYLRSKSNRKKVEEKMKKAVEKHDKDALFYFVFGYDFSPSKFTNKKVVLFSDWPIEYAIEKRFNRKPDFMEKKDIDRHKSVIEDCDICISLFKDVTNYMNDNFHNKTYYLGNLINSFYPIEGFNEIKGRNKITFIGKKSYIESAYHVIKAFQEISKKDKKMCNFELHIIGMEKKDFNNIDTNNIFFHGYLDKGNEIQKQEYYNVLKETYVIVNTSEKWAGMSSIVESMYYYRPIITSRYDEFVEQFGDNISFGLYCKNNTYDITLSIKKFIDMSEKEYKKLCINAHNSVKDYTYSAYTDKILNLVENNKKNN